ncbi:MAG: selenocysteine-specific translation elongation factor [bacterium]
MPSRHVILGTAGHIDHGKTSLVKALTGVDTDRLPEEKERGMTIDLGFAHFGDRATIIDVPGHEKFIKNMVAGVSTIDLVLFVIAADDGIMPQTMEHLEICRLLQLKRGLVVLTKMDLVEGDWLELVQEEIRKLLHGTFLEKAPVVPVSNLTGAGIEILRCHIARAIAELPPRPDRGVFWMPVDRAFTMKGFGTVVTGSVLSGQIAVGEELEILPAHHDTRVRSLQRHGVNVKQVQTGDRAAINLQGVAIGAVSRGQVLTLPNYFRATTRLNCRVQILKSCPAPVKARTRVRVHLGTAEVMARLIPLEPGEILPGASAYVQLKLEKPVAARRLDALVLRRYSPPKTIGGGVVLDAEARLLRRHDTGLLAKLRALEKEDPAELLVTRFLLADRYNVTLEQLASETGQKKDDLAEEIARLQEKNAILPVGKRGYLHRQRLESLWHQLESVLAAYHLAHPLQQGLRKAEVGPLLPPLTDVALMNVLVQHYKSEGKLKETDACLALTGHEIHFTDAQQELRRRILAQLLSSGFTPPSVAEMAQETGAPTSQLRELLAAMQSLREIVRVDQDFYLPSQKIFEAEKRLIDYLRQHHDITVSQFKELIDNASRKFAVPLLQYFDATGITERQGEKRVTGAVAETRVGTVLQEDQAIQEKILP